MEGRRHTLIFLLGLEAVQLCLVASGLARLSDAWSDRPFLVADYSLNFYWVERAVRFSSASGRLWGYDPFYCAGVPLSFVWNSATPVQMLAAYVPFLSPARAIKLFFFVASLGLPPALYGTCRRFGLTRRQACFGALAGLVASTVGLHSLMLWVGMLTGYATSYWSLFCLAAVSASFLDPSPLRWTRGLGSALLLASAFVIHKTSAVILGPPFLLLLLLLPLRRKLALVGVGLAAVLLNLPWILPTLVFLPDKHFVDSVQEWTSAATLERVLHWDTLIAPFGHFAQVFWLEALLAACVPFGLWTLRRRPQAWLLAFSVAYLGALAYLGQFLYVLHVLNPYRYVIPFTLLCAVPAAVVLERAAAGWRREALLVTVALSLLLLPGFQDFRLWLPLRAELPPRMVDLLAWIRDRTDESGRIMLEDHGYQEEKYAELDPYASTGFSRYASPLTGRAFIGGPYPYHHLRHAFAGFQNGRLFGRQWRSLSPEEVDEYLRVYNVRWIVAWSPPSLEFLDRHPERFRLDRAFGPVLRAYEVLRAGSYVLAGRARVRIDFDGVDLDGIEAEDGVLVLSLHWFPLFETDPPRELRRHRELDDPIGFIEVVDPPERLAIRNRGLP